MKRNLLRLSCLTLTLLLLTGCGSGGAAPKSLTADLNTHTPWTFCGRTGRVRTSCSRPSPFSPPWA